MKGEISFKLGLVAFRDVKEKICELSTFKQRPFTYQMEGCAKI